MAKKVKPKRRVVTPTDAKKVDAVLKEKQRRQERNVQSQLGETVHPHYSFHLHIAWDAGMVTPHLPRWELERLVYAHVQQMERFVIHRQDYIRKTGGVDSTDSVTICSIEFHDVAVSIPASELVMHGDLFKLCAELRIDHRKILGWSVEDGVIS